jgi:hypothetical protein
LKYAKNTNRTLHYCSGLILAVFIAFHLLNHLVALNGLQSHIALMRQLRFIYRNPFIETMLLIAVSVQIYSGINLTRKNNNIWKRFQIYAGFYLAFFFIFHVSAVLYGRLVQHLDTNIYYGIAGLNTYPYSFFFVPYYALAIISFFVHIACVHAHKMVKSIFGITPVKQSLLIVIAGCFCSFIILYALTNHFHGYQLPKTYQLKPFSKNNYACGRSC